MTEPTEEIIVEKKIKEKKPRTEAQLAILAEARKKALEVRKANAELRAKEKAIAKAEKEKEITARRKKVEAYNKEPEPPAEPEVEYHDPPVEKKVVKKKKKKVVVVEESESSSEEEEVVVVKKPKKKVVQEQKPQFTQEQLRQRAKAQQNYNKLYRQMNGGLC